MASPQTWIALVFALVFGIFAFRSYKVSGKTVAGMNKTLVIFVSVALVIGALYMSNVGTLMGMAPAFSIGGTGVETPATQDGGGVPAGCYTATSGTSVTLAASDEYTSAAVAGTHRYRVNGGAALTVADAGSFTASPGDKLQVLWTNANLTNYFAAVDNLLVPCSPTYQPVKTLARNGTITTRVWNTDGDLIANAAVNQTLVAGDIKTLKMEIEGAYQRGLPYGVVAVFEYNKTSLDDVILQSNGVEIPSTSIPQSDSPILGVESARKGYLIPAISSNAIQTYAVTIDADDTFNPTGTLDNIAIRYYARSYFINDKNGGSFDGPSAEDETNSLVRSGYQGSNISII